MKDIKAAVLLTGMLSISSCMSSPPSPGPGSDDGFSRHAYRDVTASKTLPDPVNAGPSLAVTRYLATMPELDPNLMPVETLVTGPNRRVYRVTLVCGTAEQCADDSVAATREALEVTRTPGTGWSIVWVGAQYKCHEGRGHQDWSKALCL